MKHSLPNPIGSQRTLHYALRANKVQTHLHFLSLINRAPSDLINVYCGASRRYCCFLVCLLRSTCEFPCAAGEASTVSAVCQHEQYLFNTNPVAYLGMIIPFGTKPIILNDNDYYWFIHRRPSARALWHSILERLFISYYISRYSTFGLADQRDFMTTKEPTRRQARWAE